MQENHQKINHKDFIQYAYVIFVTPYGRGYGCFAIKAEETDDSNINQPKLYTIASAFHAPYLPEHGKGRSFDKALLRKIATQRLRDLQCNDITLTTPYPTIQQILDQLVYEQGSCILPSWAERAYYDGFYFLTLKKSQMNWIQMVNELNAYKHFIMQIYQIKDYHKYFLSKKLDNR